MNTVAPGPMWPVVNGGDLVESLLIELARWCTPREIAHVCHALGFWPPCYDQGSNPPAVVAVLDDRPRLVWDLSDDAAEDHPVTTDPGLLQHLLKVFRADGGRRDGRTVVEAIAAGLLPPGRAVRQALTITGRRHTRNDVATLLVWGTSNLGDLTEEDDAP